MYGAPVGTITITSSTQIVPTNYAGRVFNINYLAGGTSTTIKVLNNGSAGTLYLQDQSTSSLPGKVDYGVNGHFFQNGIYILLDAQTTRATIAYRQEEGNNLG